MTKPFSFRRRRPYGYDNSYVTDSSKAHPSAARDRLSTCWPRTPRPLKREVVNNAWSALACFTRAAPCQSGGLAGAPETHPF